MPVQNLGYVLDADAKSACICRHAACARTMAPQHRLYLLQAHPARSPGCIFANARFLQISYAVLLTSVKQIAICQGNQIINNRCKPMPRYSVQIPITGYLVKEVEATDAKAAIEAAMRLDSTRDEIEEWETHTHITKGNVCYASVNSASAEEIE